MALTHTIAGLQTALDTHNDAFAAAVGAVPTSALWDTARGTLHAYTATYNGLSADSKLGGLSYSIPTPASLELQLDKAIAHEERKLRASNNRRIIRTRTGYGS